MRIRIRIFTLTRIRRFFLVRVRDTANEGTKNRIRKTKNLFRVFRDQNQCKEVHIFAVFMASGSGLDPEEPNRDVSVRIRTIGWKCGAREDSK